MRHYKKGRKLGTDASHTKAIKKNLVVNLFTNDRIKTTLERAKEIRGDVDRVVTWAKRGDVHSRRLAIAKLGNKDLVAEIFSKVEQGMFAGRPGGYTRILRLGMRRGDSATIVIMELVLEPLNKKSAKADEKPAAKKSAAKKADKADKKVADKAVAKEAATEEAADEAAEVTGTDETGEAEAASTEEATDEAADETGTDETPAAEEAPTEDAPAAEDTSAEETPESDAAPAAEETPESGEVPASESVDDAKTDE